MPYYKYNSPAPHQTAEKDPYQFNPPGTDAAVATEHSHGPTYPVSQPAGGDMRPNKLSGGMANGTHDPAGKIGGYADSVPGTKDPAYAVTSGQPPQDFPRGQAGSLVEGGPSFAPYRDKPPARGKTDFSTEDSNRGNP